MKRHGRGKPGQKEVKVRYTITDVEQRKRRTKLGRRATVEEAKAKDKAFVTRLWSRFAVVWSCAASPVPHLDTATLHPVVRHKRNTSKCISAERPQQPNKPPQCARMIDAKQNAGCRRDREGRKQAN